MSKKETKVRLSVRIKNNPKNVNKNLLVNFDPDFAEVNASSYYGGLDIPALLAD